ncbi:MAG: HNH endonuclease family protein [Acidimicrobiia bacterium]|nr:HNH endonuclease family protein [Acidimicrobiia bacterium]
MAELLTQVTITSEQQVGYDRGDWEHWIDADGDGLDTRQEVLADETLVDPVVANGRIREGQWFSYYDDQEFTVARQLDVDHVVALAEAHQSGGWAWDALTRQLYANDLSFPDHLIAVSAGSNRSKGARDPAEWLPPDSEALCTYLAWWTTIKYRWGLSMDQAEFDAIHHFAITDCADTQIDLAAAQSGIIRADPSG